MSAIDSIFESMRSVELDRPSRGNAAPSWPFFIGFVGWPYQTGVAAESKTGFTGVTGLQAQGPDGILIAAGGTVTIPLFVPRDANFLLKWIRFCAWNPAVGTRGSVDVGARSFLAAPKTLYAAPGVGSQFTSQGNQAISYDSYLSATVYLGGAGGRDYFGGLENHPQTRQSVEIPIQVQSLQAKEDGPGQLEMDALVGKNTVLSVQVTNNYSASLRVNGTAFGYKIA